MSKFNLDYIINLIDNNFNSGMKKAVTNVGDLDNKVGKVNNSIGKFTSDSKKNFNGLASAIAPIGGIIAGAFAFNSIVAFNRESKQAYIDQKQANAQLGASLISTGGIAGKTFDDLTKQAEKLQNTTLFPDETTTGAQSLLLTFTKVRGEIFDKAIPAIQDIATKMSGGGPADLKGAAIQVGKALNDPIVGITALQRVGVSFSEEQKKVIKSLVETGNIEKAQTIILKELNKEFGGSAEAARKALGPTYDTKVAMDELKESTGKLVLETQEKLVPTYLKLIDAGNSLVSTLSTTRDWIVENKDIVAAAAIGIGSYASALILLNGYQKLQAWYTGLSTAAIIVNTLVTEGATAAMVALNIAIAANPIGLLIAGLGLAAAGIYYAYQKSESFRAALAGIGEVVSTVFDIIKETFGAFASGFGKIIDGDIVGGLKDIGAGIVRTNPVGLAMTEGKRLGDAYKKGYNESIQKTASEKAIKDADYITQKRTEVLAAKGLDAKGGVVDINLVRQNFKLSDFEKNSKNPIAIALRKDLADQKSDSLSTSSGGSESVSSGNAVRNIKVDFDSIIKNLTINTQNVKEGVNDIRKIIEEEFVKIVRDAELTLSNE